LALKAFKKNNSLLVYLSLPLIAMAKVDNSRILGPIIGGVAAVVVVVGIVLVAVIIIRRLRFDLT